MTLQQLLEAIEKTEADVRQLNNLRTGLAQENAQAGITSKGNWSVYFPPAEVAEILERRHLGLQVKLNRLLAAKDAAEKTATGWMHEPQ